MTERKKNGSYKVTFLHRHEQKNPKKHKLKVIERDVSDGT
jgi:hypothetical protein